VGESWLLREVDEDEVGVSAGSVTSFLEEDTLEETRCRIDFERLCLQKRVSCRSPKPSSFPDTD
jgi:hypothetical protein